MPFTGGPFESARLGADRRSRDRPDATLHERRAGRLHRRQHGLLLQARGRHLQRAGERPDRRRATRLPDHRLQRHRLERPLTVPLYSISGTVKNSSGAAITGALVSVTGSTTGFVTTDSNGAYSLNGLRADGTYTLTPSRTHYGFTPPSSTFNTLPGNQTANFVGTLLTHNISGRVVDNL